MHHVSVIGPVVWASGMLTELAERLEVITLKKMVNLRRERGSKRV